MKCPPSCSKTHSVPSLSVRALQCGTLAGIVISAMGCRGPLPAHSHLPKTPFEPTAAFKEAEAKDAAAKAANSNPSAPKVAEAKPAAKQAADASTVAATTKNTSTPVATPPADQTPAKPAEPAKPAATATPAGPAPAAAGDKSAKAAPLSHSDDSLALHGTLSTRFRARESGDAHDLDLYSVLALDIGDASRDRVTGHFLGRLSADLDGRGNAESKQKFSSVQDSRGGAVHLDLYEAFVDVRRLFDAPLRLRAGRQLDYATPEFAHFDGLRVETDPLGSSRVVFGAYGGVPVRLYEATSIHDQIAGAWGEARPWNGGRVRGDWMHVHQEEDPESFDNDLLGLALWQRVGSNVLLEGRYTRLESENRDIRLRGTWDDGQGDLMVQAGFYRLLNPQRDFASEFDPYFAILQEYSPYSEYRLLVSKNVCKDVRLDVGGDVRRLDDQADEGRLNHDYERGYATVVVSDVFTHGLDLSLTGDAWNSDNQDIRTWGVDLTWKPNTTWRVSAGSAYALYKYDVVQDVERDNVRSWYLRMRRVLDRAWTFDLGYDYDNDDFSDYQEITAGATWHF